MIKEVKGNLVSKGKKYALIVSRFNEFLSSKLMSGAMDALERHGVKNEEMKVFWVPGSFEIPFAAAKIAEKKKYDAVLCLGAVIRGETPHSEYINSECAKGIAHVSLQNGIPVLYGVITADSLEQAIERAGTKAGNKGWDAAVSAIEMVNLYDEINKEK